MEDRDMAVEALRMDMLRRLLERQPLPGTNQAVAFPDIGYIIDAPALLIAAENLPGQSSLGDIGKPVEILPENAVRTLAEAEGDRFYIYFQPAEWRGERVRIPVEVRMAPFDPEIYPLGLGGVSAVFEKRGDDWVVVEGPVVMAT